MREKIGEFLGRVESYFPEGEKSFLWEVRNTIAVLREKIIGATDVTEDEVFDAISWSMYRTAQRIIELIRDSRREKGERPLRNHRLHFLHPEPTAHLQFLHSLIDQGLIEKIHEDQLSDEDWKYAEWGEANRAGLDEKQRYEHLSIPLKIQGEVTSLRYALQFFRRKAAGGKNTRVRNVVPEEIGILAPVKK